MFSWFGETAGALVGPLGFIVVLGPAVSEALAFAACAGLSALLVRRLPAVLHPLLFAASFTLFEWARSNGFLGVPFAQLGVTQVEGPLAALGAFVGVYGITFALCTIAGCLLLLLVPEQRRAAVSGLAAIVLCAGTAWFLWPARNAAPPTVRVAAMQGDIRQSLKWTEPALMLAVDRYTALTQASASFHPQLVVWPETVITTWLSNDRALQARFSDLARTMSTVLVVGSLEHNSNGETYNALWIYGPDGNAQIYEKHQLVPFAEFLPAASLFGSIPVTQLISGFTPGPLPRAIRVGELALGPLICWESAFSDLAYAETRDGAQVLVISTDDAWFGESAGPYQHAQIAQMRAIETGRWIVRAAATGVSGIIAPDGRYTGRTPLDTQTTVLGKVGSPVPTLYSRFGPNPIALACTLLLAGLAGRARRSPA
jgi:apolipoprotein N-acyltransferase